MIQPIYLNVGQIFVLYLYENSQPIQVYGKKYYKLASAGSIQVNYGAKELPNANIARIEQLQIPTEEVYGHRCTAKGSYRTTACIITNVYVISDMS